MKFVFAALLLISLFVCEGSAGDEAGGLQRSLAVQFTLLDSKEKNLVFTVQEHGDGTFQLLDTAENDKPVPGNQSAAWSLTNNNLSISGEVELAIGTCCREMGTLIFKSKLSSPNSFSGKLVFVTNVEEDESPYKYKSTVGTFTATRLK